MPKLIEGRRVEEYEAIERPGDYKVDYAEDGQIANVLFATPCFRDFQGEIILNVITGPGMQPPERPCWQVHEDSEGRVTASPSFLVLWPEEGIEKRFHCYLKAGVWEVLDDCVGAEGC